MIEIIFIQTGKRYILNIYCYILNIYWVVVIQGEREKHTGKEMFGKLEENEREIVWIQNVSFKFIHNLFS